MVKCSVYGLLAVGEMENSRGILAQVGKAPMRSRVEIIANILTELSSSSEGLRKTRVMYRCNLTSRQLKIYLRLLGEKGFLSVALSGSARGTSGSFEVYRITEEGLSFLKSYADLKRRLREGFLAR
jgi:predicted transcriptional regulator